MPINPIDASTYRQGGDEPASHEASVQRQIRELMVEAAPTVEEILARIQELQEENGGLKFDLYRPAGRGEASSATMVNRNQLVVRMHDEPGLVDNGPATGAGARGARRAGQDGIRETLQELNYWPVERARGRGARTEVFEYDGGRGAADMADDIRTLRDRGVVANVHVVVPLGFIIKGGNMPATTAIRLTPPKGGSCPDDAPRVRVAVIDTGIGPRRSADSWLAGVERKPTNTELLDVAPANDRLDWFSGHGSFTAGVVQQVAPDAEVVAYRFTGHNGLGSEVDLADAMIQAAEEAARDAAETGEPIRLIINISAGAPAGVDGTPPVALRDAVEVIQERYPDVLMIASAGNDGTADPMFPGALKQVVAVGALTDDMRGAPFSNHGFWVDCSTVGVGVVSTFVEGTLPPEERFEDEDGPVNFPPDPFAVWTGTSFSAPQISGAVAQLCRQNPELTPRAALNALLAGQPELPGFGRIVRILPGTPLTA